MSDNSTASSEPYENPKKKMKARTARPPPPKKAAMTPAHKEKNRLDREDIEKNLGSTPAKSSSGSPEVKTPYRPGSIPHKLREHFTCVKVEEGGYTVTCTLCTEKIAVSVGEGFGNIGKHCAV